MKILLVVIKLGHYDYLSITDFRRLEHACQEIPLESRYLSVKRVPIPNCICVSGFSNNISESILENYFENERKSGGKDVTDVKFNNEDNTCLVYFSDHTGTKQSITSVNIIVTHLSLSLSLSLSFQ